MKLKCNKDEFQRTLILAERSSSKNPSLPILLSLLIKTSKNKLIILSTNLEVGFEGHIPAKISEEGEVALPTKPLLSLMSSISDGDISIESSKSSVKLISKSSTSNLKCLPSEEFPVLPKIKKDNFFNISSDLLVEAIKNVMGAASNSSTKPELASVYLYSGNKTPLTFVSTDSFRLAEYKTDLLIKPISLILPIRSAQEVVRIFEDASEEIEIVFNKNQISFHSKNITFISRLVEGNFPDYQSIIAKSFSTQAILNKNEILGAIKAASVFSSRLSEVSLKADPSEKKLEIKSSHSDTGEYYSHFEAAISGEEVEVNFNYNYLLSAIQPISQNKIFMGFNGSTKAVLIKGFDKAFYSHLVMPMRGI